MGLKIDITIKDLTTLRGTLKKYLPETTIWAFGSRVKFTAKPASDLDLVAFVRKEQELQFSLLKDELAEAPLPFRVDLHNWNELPKNFHKNIEADYVIVQNGNKLLNHFAKEWNSYRLGDISEKIGSGATPRGGKEAYLEFGEISLIRSQNVLDFSFSKNGLAYISEEQAHDLRNVIVEEDDVLLNITGDSVARVCQVPLEILPARVNQHVAIIRGKKEILNQSFLKYYLLEPSFKRYMLGLASAGATRNALTKVMIENFEIKAPEIDDQKEIASILSSLDNKIELNLQMNQTLEAMAQAIFKEWFVNFNFPGFDGELVDGLPKGWKMGKLGDVCERITKGTTPTTLKKQFVEKGINFIKAEGIDDIGNFIPEKFAFIDEETNEMLKRSIIQENDIVFTIAGTLGRVAKVDKSILPANTNQAVAIIRVADNEMVNFVYHLLRSDLIKSTLLSKAVHAVQANISLGVLSAADIVIPTEKIIQLFNEILNPIEEKLLSNVYETRTLTQIRDSLLPKLMTGKIEIQA